MTSRLDASLVGDGGTIRDAMVALDAGARQIVLVIDSERRLVGVVTDGDLRRAILGRATPGDPLAPYVVRRPVTVGPDESRAEVLELMRARRISAIPVIDGNGRPVGLHRLHEFLEPVVRPNWAVVMAGGAGTRLRPLTEALPKPMLRVAGRPILERIVLHLIGHGIKRVFVATNYLSAVIEEHFGDGSQFGCSIDYIREEQPLGTGGALGLLPVPPTDPVIVMNGDLVTTADVGRLLDFHALGGYVATVAVRQYVHRVPFGVVKRRGTLVERIDEKPTLVRDVNAGIYVLEPTVVDRVAPNEALDLPVLIGDVIDHGEPVGAFEVSEDWIDVGEPKQLERARHGGRG